jgi:hypothetical protein
MKDAAGNLINLTIFESFLSKYLIENSQFFEPVLQKIFTHIEKIITENKDERSFDRVLYGVLSAVNDAYPGHTTIESLRKNFDLLTATYFLKLVFDCQLLSKYTQSPPFERKPVPSLSALCQQTLFRHPSQKTAFLAYLKHPALFDKRNRGVLPARTNQRTTKKLGITTIETTPAALASYFANAHEPAQFEYKPNPKSNVGKWFTRHNLPIIAGTSGSASLFLTEILKISTFDPSEIRLLLIGLAAAMVAEGHHSYFEVMVILDRFGFKLKSKNTLSEFYEQTLPQSILSMDSFIAFRNSPQGVALLEDIRDNISESQSPSRELPILTIGM